MWGWLVPNIPKAVLPSAPAPRRRSKSKIEFTFTRDLKVMKANVGYLKVITTNDVSITFVFLDKKFPGIRGQFFRIAYAKSDWAFSLDGKI